MRIRVGLSRENAERMLLPCLLLASLSGCATSGLQVDPFEIAAPLVSMAIRADSREGGELKAYLSDGRMLEGNWAKVSESRPASAVLIRTPDREITAEALADPDLPFATAYLHGEGSQMLCAVVGDALSGYTSHCAESSGARWIGLAWQHHLVAGYTTFHGDLTVRLSKKR